MKNVRRYLLYSALVVIVTILGRYLLDTFRGKKSSLPAVTAPVTAAAPSSTPSPTAPKTVVAIQDGKTLDFSSGKPVLKDSADEKAIIEQSVKEMNEAAASVTFGPAPKAPAPK